MSEGRALLRRAAILAILGATFGTLFDYAHVATGAIVYPKPTAIGVAWWVPFLYTCASLAIGLAHPAGDRMLGRGSTYELGALRLAIGFVGLCAVWFASGAIPLSSPVVSAILAPAAIGLWALFDRTWQGFVLAIVTAIVGCAVEIGLSGAGLFRHTHQDVWGIPVWLPWLYVAASIGLGNVGRRLAIDAPARAA